MIGSNRGIVNLGYLFALLAASIFAVELYANLIHGEGVIAWIHLIVIGGIELFLLGYLIIGPATWLRSRRYSDRGRTRIRT